MFIVSSYSMAILFCIITMICWGSWANTRKLSLHSAPFQIFYWDYGIGVLAFTLLAAFTMGSHGSLGRAFLSDLQQAQGSNLGLAALAGVIFNLANLLLVAVIDLAGMAVAFPITVGLALVLGVIVNYLAIPVGNPYALGAGVALVVAAILISANIHSRLKPGTTQVQAHPQKNVVLLSVVSGVLMGSFYRFIAASMSASFEVPEVGKLTPYTALVLFSVGVVLSSFIFNTWLMKRPFTGAPISMKLYWKQNFSFHCTGFLGGIIWGIGTLLNVLAAAKAGFAISYGLGQGATMIAALWGVFVWREFANAPAGTNRRLGAMFVCYLFGLISIILARVA